MDVCWESAEVDPQALDALRSKSPDLRGLAEIRLLALEDGPGRGQRLIVCRNAAGFECEISVDRGFDISAVRWRGTNLGWNGPVGGGVPAQGLDAEDGLGLLRSFDGFLVTCGLDHFGVPATGSAEHYIYPHRQRTHWPLHGRICGVAATLRGYGIDLERESPILWCEGELRQAALFGEVLLLRRRIEVSLFEPGLSLRDRISNEGRRPARHGLLYHINVGYPLLDEQAALCGDFPQWLLGDFASSPPIPDDAVRERFDACRSIGSSSGVSRVGVRNPRLDGGIQMDIAYSATRLPGLGLWRAWQAGIYALGIEPHSELAPSDARYRAPSTPGFIEPGDSLDYQFDISVASLA